MICAENRYQLCVRNVMDKVMNGTLWLVLSFILFTPAGHAQIPVQIKGVLSKADSFRANQRPLADIRTDESDLSQNSSLLGLKQVRKTVRNNHISIEFVLENRSRRTLEKLYFAILLSDDRIIGHADKIATKIYLSDIQNGQQRNFKVQFNLPPETQPSTYVGYTISEVSPEKFLTKTVKPAAAGAKIRLNQSTLTINQAN